MDTEQRIIVPMLVTETVTQVLQLCDKSENGWEPFMLSLFIYRNTQLTVNHCQRIFLASVNIFEIKDKFQQ